MSEDYQGKCIRHQLRFKPNKSFDNMCPACWWEREARSRATKAPDGVGVSGRDGPVYLKNIGGGTFVEINPPDETD